MRLSGVVMAGALTALAGCGGDEEPAAPGDDGGLGDDGDGTPGDDETPTDGSEGDDEDGTPAGGDSDGGSGEDEPDYGDWFADVDNYDGTVDMTGEQAATVAVGAGDDGLVFEPAAILVDPGTTVTWEWTGEGGAHNVVHEDGEFESDLQEEQGATFEHTFDQEGTYPYYCEPHRDVGMKGAVTAGTGDDTGDGGGDTGDDGAGEETNESDGETTG